MNGARPTLPELGWTPFFAEQLSPEEADRLIPARVFGVQRTHITVMAEEGEWAKYVHGTLGEGTWTFFGGHDPEDYQHAVGDPPTDLSRHPNSPGYRLILNNILFPAAEKKEQKT